MDSVNPGSKRNSRYIGDEKLIPRIRKYLDDNKSKKHVTIQGITQSLQDAYSEYKRKKRNSFQKSVEKAYDMLCGGDNVEYVTDRAGHLEAQHLSKRRKHTPPDENDDDLSYSSENEEYVAYQDSNSINNFMTDLYKSSPRNIQPPANVAANVIKRATNTSRDSGIRTPNTETSVSDISRPTTPYNDNNSVVLTDLESSSVIGFIDRGEKARTKNEPIKRVETEVIRESRQMKKSQEVKTPRRTKQKEEESRKKGPEITNSSVTFADLGGIDNTLKEICKLLVHMKHPEVYKMIGVTPPRGILLHGPPGCGKTLLAHAIAGELLLPFIKIAAPEIVSGVSGESEEKVRELFDKAISSAPCIVFIDEIDAITPKRETASKDMEKRIVAQLLSCMDDLSRKSDAHVLVIGATNRPDSLDPALRRAGRFDREICLGIPNEKSRIRILEVLCRSLKLSADFDFQVLARNTPGYVGADLTALTREAAMSAINRIFKSMQDKNNLSTNQQQMTTVATESFQEMLDNINVNKDTSFISIDTSVSMETKITNTIDMSLVTCNKSLTDNSDVAMTQCGNDVTIATDVIATTTTAEAEGRIVETDNEDDFQQVLLWLKDQAPLSPEQLEDLFITQDDFTGALKLVQPSAKREGFATIPDVTWDDIGALTSIREELELAIMAPVRHPEHFMSLGLTSAPGILLAGPPGCGKTLLAKAVANESGINFISVKGPELLNMYVGESERAVRQVFQRARNSAPCVIFFDELDSLCPKRSDSGEGGASVRVVNQLLTEMDGLEERKNVFIVGATNRPDIIDPAILRPGRLDKLLYVGLPTEEDRHDILRTITKNGSKPKLAEDVNLRELAIDAKCDGFTGADLTSLVREASVTALKEFITQIDTIERDTPTTNKDTPIIVVAKKHFDLAFTKVKPSVSMKDQERYERMKCSFTP